MPDGSAANNVPLDCGSGKLDPPVICTAITVETTTTDAPAGTIVTTEATTKATTKAATLYTTKWTGRFPPGCSQPIDGVLTTTVVDQFQRYGRFGYVIKISINQVCVYD